MTEHKRLLQDAKMQLKRSKRKDYYKILGVSKNASDDEIKKSYRKMALVHHPGEHLSVLYLLINSLLIILTICQEEKKKKY